MLLRPIILFALVVSPMAMAGGKLEKQRSFDVDYSGMSLKADELCTYSLKK